MNKLGTGLYTGHNTEFDCYLQIFQNNQFPLHNLIYDEPRWLEFIEGLIGMLQKILELAFRLIFVQVNGMADDLGVKERVWHVSFKNCLILCMNNREGYSFPFELLICKILTLFWNMILFL